MTHLGNRGAAPAGVFVRAACYQRIRRLANPIDMIKCGRCGNANGSEVVYCQFCGTRLTAEPLSEVPLGRQAPVASAPPVASNRSTDRMVDHAPAASPIAAAIRVGQQQVGFRLVVVHRDGTDGISYNLLGDQIDIGRTEGDLLFEDPHLAPRHARVVASLTGRSSSRGMV